ncbi:MAG: ribonuclease H-like domain-containing protein [Planctomyces sp.]
MITEALRHCPGIGPTRLKRLHDQGIRTWHDVLSRPHDVPAGLRESLTIECRGAVEALDRSDISWFVDRLHVQDRWRILSQFHDDATCFDIETTGLEHDAEISVIVCWHRGQLHHFVEHENLDDFLDLLDDVRLLVSFNGSTFDVPRVLDSFHIPSLPCPHIDIRWSCYHRGLTGSLKQITDRLGFRRPSDLRYADGELAVLLWNDWLRSRNPRSREMLLRYCGADVVLLKLLMRHLAVARVPQDGGVWAVLDSMRSENPVAASILQSETRDPVSGASDQHSQVAADRVDAASPKRGEPSLLRMLKNRKR